MAKSINIYKSISDYKEGYDERKNISLSLIIDDEEEDIVDSHVKIGFVTFTSEEAGSTIGLDKLSTYQLLEYTTDQVVNPSEMCYPVWKKMDVDTIITLENAGDMVHFRGVLSGNNNNEYNSNYTKFKMTGKIAASGNCNALWNYNDLNAPLKEYCGYYMFQDCTSLTTAPELPATTLARCCYFEMFKGCTSLTQAPELPATTLSDVCYYGMFNGCSSLNYIKCLATDMSKINCTTNWVDGVSQTGTFVKASGISWSTGSSGIPSDWEVIEEDTEVVEE